jgi:predicted nucleic acid-binding protein
MRCLDTPLLEDLLLGKTRAKKWLDKADAWGGEIAATEASMVELALIAKEMGRGSERRLLALEALRRELTVLPFDAEAARAAIALAKKSKEELSPLTLLVAGSAIAHGAVYLLTDHKRPFPRDLGPVKLARI